MDPVVQEYVESEAGLALRDLGFLAVNEGGIVVFRAERFGVTFDVMDAGTGMAPRYTAHRVRVYVHAGTTTDEAWEMNFTSLKKFIATLE